MTEISVIGGESVKLESLRTTGPLFRTYEPSDYRTFITESCKSRYRTYEPSDCRTFGMKNPLFRTHEPSDYRTFGLESSYPRQRFIVRTNDPCYPYTVKFVTISTQSNNKMFGNRLHLHQLLVFIWVDLAALFSQLISARLPAPQLSL